MLAIVTQAGNTVVESVTFNVSPTSNGCSTAASLTTCRESLVLAPGAYDANVATYDGANGTGHELSEQSSVPFDAVQGVANSVALTLYGVPHSIVIAAASSNVRGSQASGFSIYGSDVKAFTVTAYDADGAAIVGTGAPTWSVVKGSGAGLTLAQPANGTFDLAATTNDGVESLTATASFLDSSVCAQSGATCSATFSAQHVQYLFYCENTTDVKMLAPPYTGASKTITGPADWIATGADGDLFVFNGTTVTDFPPPYTSAAAAFTVSGSREIAADGNGNLFATGSNSFYESFAGSYGTATSTPFPSSGLGYAIAANGSHLVVATTSAYVYKTNPLALVATVALTQQGYQGVAVDDGGDVATIGNNQVNYYASATNYAAQALAFSGLPEDIAMNHRGDILAYSSSTSLIDVYAWPHTAGQAANYTIPLANTLRFAFDITDDLFAGSTSGLFYRAYPYNQSSTQRLGSLSVPIGNVSLTP
ncbi:MAG: hypothetical protein KGN02_05900 [bacterium]|nr:hypothetical protein [bacterium]